jgi:hypothetical protein
MATIRRYALQDITANRCHTSEGAMFETTYHRTDLGETLIRLLRS